MNFLTHTLQTYPEIAIFLTLAIGFWIGSLKFGSFSLGVVTSSLLAGLLVGQLHVTVAPVVQSTFFLMFLFSVGYEVGPQFFRALKSDGLPQVAFTLIVCIAALATAYVMAKLLHYDVGLSAGLMAGGTTNSGALGVATDSIKSLALGAGPTASNLTLMAIAYAVTYPFGTAGTAWILSSLAPKLMRVDLVAACKELEAKLGVSKLEPGVFSAYRPIAVRAYRPGSLSLSGRRVQEIEAQFGDPRLFIVRVRQDDTIIDCTPETIFREVTALTVAGPTDMLLAHRDLFGAEVDDAAMLDYAGEILDVVVTKKEIAGKTVKELAAMDLGRLCHGVFLRNVSRSGHDMALHDDMEIRRGDVVTIRGAKRDVERVARPLGYADRPTDKTDVLFMSLGIALGAVLGAVTIHVGGVPLAFSTSVGALVAGLVCGYLRSMHRTFGRIPAPALWVFNNLGLNGFVAIVGIGAGPGFVSGLAANGIGILLSGVVVSLVPLLVALAAGKYIFKFHPGILFGAAAGARSATASIAAVQEAAKSKVPLLGYTIPYACSRVVMALWGVAIVLLMK